MSRQVHGSGQIHGNVRSDTPLAAVDIADRTFRHPLIRAITAKALLPGDELTVQAVFDGLSPRSRRMRYLAAMPRLSPSALRRLADVDHRTRGAWFARDADVVVGLARYAVVILDDGTRSAEIAMEIVDTHHRRGVGGFLLDVLAIVLQELDIEKWHWTGHPSNTAMRRLTAGMGATWRHDSGDIVGHALIGFHPCRRVLDANHAGQPCVR